MWLQNWNYSYYNYWQIWHGHVGAAPLTRYTHVAHDMTACNMHTYNGTVGKPMAVPPFPMHVTRGARWSGGSKLLSNLKLPIELVFKGPIATRNFNSRILRCWP